MDIGDRSGDGRTGGVLSKQCGRQYGAEQRHDTNYQRCINAP
jgi:hypothetical protein